MDRFVLADIPTVDGHRMVEASQDWVGLVPSAVICVYIAAVSGQFGVLSVIL